MSKARPFSGWPPSARPTAALIVPPWRHRDHVPARLLGVDALDRAADAVIEIHETLAAGRGFVDRRQTSGCRPAGWRGTPRDSCPAIRRDAARRRRFSCGIACGLGKSGGPDRVRGLMRALQIACIPDRVARQDFADRLEHHAIAGVAAEILLPVDAAAVLAHRRMAHPPPARRDHRSVCLDWTSRRPFNTVCCRCTSEHASSQVTSTFEILFEFRKAASADAA